MIFETKFRLSKSWSHICEFPLFVQRGSRQTMFSVLTVVQNLSLLSSFRLIWICFSWFLPTVLSHVPRPDFGNSIFMILKKSSKHTVLPRSLFQITKVCQEIRVITCRVFPVSDPSGRVNFWNATDHSMSCMSICPSCRFVWRIFCKRTRRQPFCAVHWRRFMSGFLSIHL